MCSCVSRLDRIRPYAAANSRFWGCSAGGGDAVAVAVRVLDVVEGQDPRGRIVAALIDEVNGHAAASSAAVLEELIGERTDLCQREGGPLREEADPPFVDVAVEGEAARHTLVPRPGGDGHGLIGAHADDMVATVVHGRRVLVRGPDSVSQNLYDRLRAFVVPGRQPAKAGATAVDTQRGGSAEGGGESDEAGERCGKMHFGLG